MLSVLLLAASLAAATAEIEFVSLDARAYTGPEFDYPVVLLFRADDDNVDGLLTGLGVDSLRTLDEDDSGLPVLFIGKNAPDTKTIGGDIIKVIYPSLAKVASYITESVGNVANWLVYGTTPTTTAPTPQPSTTTKPTTR